MTRSRRALQLSSVLALAVCLLAQLAGAVHSAAVRHVACSEHGGVVELHGERGPAALTAHAALEQAPDESHHAHCERCATPTARGDGAAPVRSGLPRFVAVTTPVARPQPAPAIACFRLAPKGSPPRSV